MEYLPAIAVEQIRTVNDPAKIAIRDKALLIIDGYMRKDEALKIKYAAKYASIQNAYKKWQGEVLGLTKTNAFLKKKNYENIFQQRVNANAGLKQQYGNVLQNLAEAYKNMEPFGLGRDYYNELFSKIELYAIGMQLNSLVTAHSKGEAVYASRLKQVQTSINDLLDEYDVQVDKKIFETLIEIYAKRLVM